MASAFPEHFTVLRAHTLVSGFPLRFTAADAWGDSVVLGTAEGALVTLSPVPASSRRAAHSGGGDGDYHVASTLDGFAPGGVSQLAVLEDEQLLLCLSDGKLTAHALPGFQPAAAPGAASLSRARSVNMFHWDAQRGVLCVATKRSLLLFRYDDARSDFAPGARDLAVPERVQCVGWAGDGLCLGFKREYVMLNIATGAMGEVFPTGRAGSPAAMALPPDELLLVRDAVGVPVGHDGKASAGGAKGVVSWSEAPLALAPCPPFAAGLLPRGVVELCAVAPQGQRASGGGAPGSAVQELAVGEGAHLLVASPSGWLLAASSDTVTQLRPVALAEQVQELAGSGAFQAALMLCEAAAHQEEPDDGGHRAAATGGGMTRAAAVARLRCDVHRRFGFTLFAAGSFSEAMTHFQSAGAAVAPTQVLALFPGLLPAEHPHTLSADAREQQQLVGPKLSAALAALLPYIQAAREAAWQQRRRGGGGVSDDDLRVLDTACVQVMLDCGSPPGDALMRLLILPNAVDLDTGERSLSAAGRHAELVALYRSRGRHRSALLLLNRLGRAAAATGGSATSQFGPRAVVEYLLAMKQQEEALILEFSPAVCADSPSDGLALFTRAQPPLPVSVVLPHLRQHAPQLCAPYLEAELRSPRGAAAPAEFHNTLVLLRQEAVSRERAAAGPAWEEGSRSEARVALLACLADSRVRYAPERLLSRFPGDAQALERSLLLRRLGRHTEALRLYVRPQAVDVAGAEAYADEVWAQQQQQQRQWQQQSGASQQQPLPPPGGDDPAVEGPSDVYISLLQVLMEQHGSSTGGGADATSQVLTAALGLLIRRADRIDGSRALALLPPTLPLAPLLPFFAGALRSARENRRHASLERALRRRENLAARGALAEARDRHVVIHPERMCALCPGRIGGAVFAVFPDNRVAHYTCYVREQPGGKE